MENRGNIKLTMILNEIVEEDITNFLNGDATKKFFIELKDYYSANTRHLYHELAYFIVQMENSEEMDYLIDKIYWIYEKSKKSEERDILERILKLYDHLKLEKVHFDSLEKLNNQLKDNQFHQIEQFTEDMKESLEEHGKKLLISIDEAKGKIKQTENTLKNVQDELKTSERQMYTQVVAILGIFTAIVFSMFAGLTMINSIVQALSSNTLTFFKACTICLLVGFIVFNLLYTMLYAISKMIGKPIAYANPKLNEEKYKNVGVVKKASLTHPYCFGINVTIIIFLIIVILFNLLIGLNDSISKEVLNTNNLKTTTSSIIIKD